MVRQLLPAGLAEIAPGPELGALLAGIDISALSGSDVVEVLRARARQLSHDQARLLATMVEVGLCDPAAYDDEVSRLSEPPAYAADEIRAALAWTRRAADRELNFAEALVLRMPAVFTALETGRIDRSKAWVFADLCADLTPEQTEVVCTRLLPHAERLTTGELAARIKKLAIALDPQWAARRYATAVRERTVIGYLGPEGTATITGSGLPADQAASACARIEELARAAKRAGHPSRIGPLRADIYLGLLDGRWQHHTGDQIITDLLTDTISETDGADPRHPAEPDAATGGEHPASDARGDAPADTANTDDPAAQNTTEDSDSRGSMPDGYPTGPEPGTALPVRRVGVEVRVGLATLLGRDQHPGEIPGWGPVPAGIARTMVAAQRAAEWRFAITDPTGQLLLAGITRRRPHHPAPDHTTLGHTASQQPRRGGVVELQLPATLLTDLAASPESCGEWAGIVTDIATQYTQYTQCGPGKPHAQDPTTRFAGAALRRHVQIRDRFCVYPGCRATACSADLDHTHDHALGGPTTDTNSGPLCRHDHQLKTAGWWRLHQAQPGHFT
ncbi:MAG TPA: DUF222 domain-containing protein [Pseudonocardiaceae bacterium]|nr:DUF222 domain-containing protein [Pseudonocardiaceae bacterium]